MKRPLIKTAAFAMSVFFIFLTFEISFGQQRGASKKNGKNPQKDVQSIFAPEARYEFAPVYEGVKIKHGFVILNRGTQPLEIKEIVLP